MDFFYWIGMTAAVYAVTGTWIYILIDAARRKPVGAVCLFAATVAESVIAWRIWQRFDLTLLLLIPILAIFWLTVTRPERKWQDLKAQKELRRHIGLHLALVTGSCIFLVPFVWLVTTSLKDDVEINHYPPVWIPTQPVMTRIDGRDCPVSKIKGANPSTRVATVEELDLGKVRVRVLSGRLGSHSPGDEMVISADRLVPLRVRGLKWKNYSDALRFLPPEYKNGLVPLWNTIYVTLLSIIGTLFSSSLVAYSFARLRWPGREILFVVLLATMMVPGAVTMLPVFLIFRWLGWVDTLRPLWIGSFFGGAFNIFLLRQFFMTIPTDLEDAAKIDGCSLFGIYWRIMLPLIKPALAAITIFTFMGSWNNFMGPLIYISSPEKMTLAYALQLFQGAHGGERAMMMAASTLVMLPVLLVFFFTQRYFIQGVTLTGLKG